MNKVLIILTLLLLLSACNEQNERKTAAVNPVNKSKSSTMKESPFTIEIQARLKKALAQAKKDKDTRLFATKGRSVVIVGIAPENFVQAKQLCGIKFLSGSGDVLKNAQDKATRRANYQFALRYNQQIMSGCLN